MEIKVLVDVKTKLGECPTWDAVRQRLFWVDIVDGRLFCCDEFGGNIRAWEVHKKIGSFALQENYNGAIVALEDGLYQLDFDTGNLKFICNPEPDLPQNRLNDGRVDRQGRFVFGSMNRLEDGNTASLYRLDADYKIEKLENNIILQIVFAGVLMVLSSILQTHGKVKSGLMIMILKQGKSQIKPFFVR